jgi:hypothetical protein
VDAGKNQAMIRPDLVRRQGQPGAGLVTSSHAPHGCSSTPARYRMYRMYRMFAGMANIEDTIGETNV